jgi:transposase
VPNSKPPYPPEFRAEAVRLARQLGNSIRQVAQDLGIANESLRRWILQLDVERGDKPGFHDRRADELGRLRRENRRLRMEREILEKAAVFFATETDETG